MCLAFISFYQAEECPLIILNNRDEICERPTIPLEEFKLSRDEIEPLRDIGYSYYCGQDKINNQCGGGGSYYYSKDEDIRIYCGRDKVGGGTWVGTNNRGKFCTILNLYNKNFHASSSTSGKLSRGKILHNYLSSKISPFDYILLMERYRNQYQPFILIIGDIINSSEKYYCFLSHLLPSKELYNDQLPINSYPSQLKVIERNSIFGISNYPLDWNTNKVLKGKLLLDSTLKSILKEKNILVKDDIQIYDSYPHCCNNDDNNNNNNTSCSNNSNSNNNTSSSNNSNNNIQKYNNHQNQKEEQSLFTNSDELKLLNILYNDDKDELPPALTEHINTSSIFVHPYHSKHSTKVHSTVSSSLITFTKAPTTSTLMTFTQVDNINNKTYKIKTIIK